MQITQSTSGHMKSGDWKNRLYSAYVSSGQARFSYVDRDKLFAGRKALLTKIISHAQGIRKDAPVLDLGCGHGALVYFLREAGFKTVTGVDMSAEQIEAGAQLGISGLIHSDLSSYMRDKADGSVRLIFLLDVLEHLTRDELFSTMDEVFRLLDPGGLCIIHVPNAEGIFGMRIRYDDLTHEQGFTPRSMNQLLSIIGFDRVKCFEDRPVVHGIHSAIRRLLWHIGTLPFRLIFTAETGTVGSILSANMLIVAEK